MDAKQIAELEKLVKEATPGPWTADHQAIIEVAEGQFMTSPNVTHEECEANAALTCALRNAADELIAAVKERDEAIAEVNTLATELHEADANYFRLKAHATEQTSRAFASLKAAVELKLEAEKERDQLAEQVGTLTKERDRIAAMLPNIEQNVSAINERMKRLEAERDELKAHVAELEKDRERLDWLSKRGNIIKRSNGECVAWEYGYEREFMDTNPRRAIDAAMKEGKCQSQ